MAFDNDKMMKFLEERANALKSGKFEKANEVEVKMTEYKNKEGNLEHLTQPKLFYCTFHMEYAYSKALFYHTFPLLGEDVEIKQAIEPTDIIWENQQVRKNERMCRWIFVVFIMIILTFGCFSSILWLLKKKIIV